MPSKDRMHEMVRQLVEAALDQPKPTPELRTALNTFLEANEHRARLQRQAPNRPFVVSFPPNLPPF